MTYNWWRETNSRGFFNDLGRFFDRVRRELRCRKALGKFTVDFSKMKRVEFTSQPFNTCKFHSYLHLFGGFRARGVPLNQSKSSNISKIFRDKPSSHWGSPWKAPPRHPRTRPSCSFPTDRSTWGMSCLTCGPLESFWKSSKIIGHLGWVLPSLFWTWRILQEESMGPLSDSEMLLGCSSACS